MRHFGAADVWEGELEDRVTDTRAETRGRGWRAGRVGRVARAELHRRCSRKMARGKMDGTSGVSGRVNG